MTLLYSWNLIDSIENISTLRSRTVALIVVVINNTHTDFAQDYKQEGAYSDALERGSRPHFFGHGVSTKKFAVRGKQIEQSQHHCYRTADFLNEVTVPHSKEQFGHHDSICNQISYCCNNHSQDGHMAVPM